MVSVYYLIRPSGSELIGSGSHQLAGAVVVPLRRDGDVFAKAG